MALLCRHIPGMAVSRARVRPFTSTAKRTIVKCQCRIVRHKSSAQLEQSEQVSLQPDTLLAVLGLTLTAASPALAQSDFVPSYDPKSYWVSLGLFVMTLPGLWSLIKRAPKSKVVRKTYEVEGPAKPNAMPIDDRARQIFRYFKKYNYEVKETGDVITFEGLYGADKSQAAALVLYTFFSLASTALVLSIAVPEVGNWWYLMTLISPAAGAYYWSQGTRTEQIRVKMVTSDDEATTDIVIEGDSEEVERFWQELGLVEKGKVYVKGILG